MHISLSRTFSEDKLAWLDDLDRRVQVNYRSHERWGYDLERIEPPELDLMDQSQSQFRHLYDQMVTQGWYPLGYADEIEHLTWLVQQDSWCVVDIPFTKQKKILTKDPFTELKFCLKFGRYVEPTRIAQAILEHDWTKFPLHWKSSPVPDWCKANCSDIYFFHTVENLDGGGRPGPARTKHVVFIDKSDALRFKLSGIGEDS